MKTSRKLQLIDKDISELLIKQLAHELKNYNLYKSFANYFSVEAIENLSVYFNLRAAEELLHHEWIVTYLSNADVKFTYPAIEVNTEVCSNWIDPFIHTVSREIQTTQMIYNIYEAAMSSKDYMTASWLFKDLIREQIEEENTSRMARTIMEEDADIFIKAGKILKLLNS